MPKTNRSRWITHIDHNQSSALICYVSPVIKNFDIESRTGCVKLADQVTLTRITHIDDLEPQMLIDDICNAISNR